jgi:hypothetical protein
MAQAQLALMESHDAQVGEGAALPVEAQVQPSQHGSIKKDPSIFQLKLPLKSMKRTKKEMGIPPLKKKAKQETAGGSTSSTSFAVTNLDLLFFEFFFDLIISPSIENSSVLIASLGADSSSSSANNNNTNLPISAQHSALLTRFRLALLKYQVLHYFLVLISDLDRESSTNLSRPDHIFKCFIDSAVAHGITFH